MYGWEQRVLVKHYLEQGLTKTAIAERFLRVLPGGLPEDPDAGKDESLPHLEQAIQLVDEFRNDARFDHDFDPVRTSDAFQALIYGAKPPAHARP